MALTDQFAGLPLGQLIAQPLIEVARGQTELCSVYLDFLFKLAFKGGKPGGETQTIKFKLNRQIVSPEGDSALQPIDIEAPLLSLVPVPAFVMDEATVKFSMEVKEQTGSKDTGSQEVTSELGFKRWGFTAKVAGKVTASQERTRQTDNSARYEIYARAAQQAPSEGMAKLTSIFASVIEPIESKGT